MHGHRMLIVFLPGKAAQDDRASFLICVLISNGSSVRRNRDWTRGTIFHLELFLKAHGLELRGSPLHCELLIGSQLFFANSQHFVPSEAGNSGLSMSSFIHPASTGFDKKVSACSNVPLQYLRFLSRQH